jgi:cob(I)alamin adenosyltransferase
VRTFNKKGDEGETSLLFGVRVSKADPRCEAYGTVDEASSALGLACCFSSSQVAGILRSIQEELVVLSGELALPRPQDASRLKRRLTSQMTQRLQEHVEALEGGLDMPQRFILPGGCPSAAALDLARATTRRAERAVVRVRDQGLLVSSEVLPYLNRLADLLFTLARHEEEATAGNDSPR